MKAHLKAQLLFRGIQDLPPELLTSILQKIEYCKDVMNVCQVNMFLDQCTSEFYAIQAQKNNFSIPANLDRNLARDAFNSMCTGHNVALARYFQKFKRLVSIAGDYDDHIMNAAYVEPPTVPDPNTLQSFGCTTIPYLNRYGNLEKWLTGSDKHTPLVIVLNTVVSGGKLDKHLSDDFQWLSETLNENFYVKHKKLIDKCSEDIEDGIVHHNIFTINGFEQKLSELITLLENYEEDSDSDSDS